VVFATYVPRVSAYKQPLLYNLAVTKEVLKQIYVKEGLQPPSIDAYRSAYKSLWVQVKAPGFVSNLLRSGDLGRVGVYGLQAYGIFKVRSFLVVRLLSAKTNIWIDWRNYRTAECCWLQA